MPKSTDIKKVLVALDCTTDVADEAASKGCDMVLTHHPLMFHAIKHIMPDEPATAPIYRLIRKKSLRNAANGHINTGFRCLIRNRNAVMRLVFRTQTAKDCDRFLPRRFFYDYR